jgi:hypothetical protein
MDENEGHQMENGEREVNDRDENEYSDDPTDDPTPTIGSRHELATVVFGSMINTIGDMLKNRHDVLPLEIVEYYAAAVDSFNHIVNFGEIKLRGE